MIDYSERRTRVPGICPPRSVIAPAGDVLIMAPYLVIGAALWSNRGSTDAPGHESFMIILGVGVLVGRSHS